MDRRQLTEELKAEAARLGFDSAGICAAATPTGIGRFNEWLESGYAGQMHYLVDRQDAYHHPRHVMNGVRSIVMLIMNYSTQPRRPSCDGQARVSRYAWGTADYHDVIHGRLKSLAEFATGRVPGSRVRGVVDTAPLLEREFARMAGLGWIGKNTLLLNKRNGSWFFLAALLTDVELECDQPYDADHCGTCRACLDACPTDAFPQPYVLDATRCISYLTIELRDSMPPALRPELEDWVFGCDVCQDVCPWNHRTPNGGELAFEPDPTLDPIDLVTLFDLDDREFRRRFRATPLWRAKRRGILRNAAIVLGNRRCDVAMEPLCRGLRDEEPLVRAACAWALGRYDEVRASAALKSRLAEEVDQEVRDEIQSALFTRKLEGRE